MQQYLCPFFLLSWWGSRGCGRPAFLIISKITGWTLAALNVQDLPTNLFTSDTVEEQTELKPNHYILKELYHKNKEIEKKKVSASEWSQHDTPDSERIHCLPSKIWPRWKQWRCNKGMTCKEKGHQNNQCFKYFNLSIFGVTNHDMPFPTPIHFVYNIGAEEQYSNHALPLNHYIF